MNHLTAFTMALVLALSASGMLPYPSEEPAPAEQGRAEPVPAEPGPQGSDATDVAALSRRPDIVMLMLDDVSPHDGRLWQHLPTLQREFVERGVEFTDFHGETPTCCPGRAGFLTGLHTDAHGVRWNDGRLLKPGMTIATQLHRAGYHTIYGGKYLNGYERIPDKVPPGWDRFHGMSGDYYRYAMWSDGRREWHGSRPRDYSTDVIRRKLLAALRSAPRQKRLFLVIAPWAAHVPRTPAPRHRDTRRCKTIERWKPPDYMEVNVGDKPAYIRRRGTVRPNGFDLRPVCRVLLSVDELFAAVVAELKRQGRYQDTLLLLTADNGMNFGAHRFLEDKKTPFATRLPFFAAWPKALGSVPRQVHERLQNIDLAPTLCELAGCRLGPYPTGQRRADGKSFAGLLRDTGPGPRRGVILSSFETPGALKVPRWYAVTTTRHSGLAAQGCALARGSGCRWTYVEYETGEKELYDLSNGPCWEWSQDEVGDPCRLHNLAGKRSHRRIQRELRKLLMVQKARAPH